MIETIINDHLEQILNIKNFIPQIEKISDMIFQCMINKKKLLLMGNGGSAADSQHIAAEFVGRFQKERKGYPAIALTTDTSILTSIANDYSYDVVFSRQVESLAQNGDIVFGFSTSGKSKNIGEAFKKAKDLGCCTIALLGKDGGFLKEMADLSIIIPSETTARIQECHIFIGHIICEKVENKLYNLENK